MNKNFGVNTFPTPKLTGCCNFHFISTTDPPRIVREHLNQNFGQQRTGRVGAMNWPARSPDFNPLDLSLIGRLKTLVYSDTVIDGEALTTSREYVFGVSSKTTNV
jgi:hypothetical protein